ncbi:MAG: cytidylate kinase family protein [Pseudomonadota bacterium]
MAIITISRGSLSGGDRFAALLAERLGYQTISREVLVEAAQKYGVNEKRLSEEMHNPPKFWERFAGHRERYLLAVQATLAEMVENGNTIYHGQAGQFLLKGLSQVIKLRLIAPRDYRATAAMEQRKLSRDEALRYVDDIDEQRRKWVRYFYNADCSDPSLYDMVINLEQMSMESAVDLVHQLASRDSYAFTEARKQELHDFVLTTRVRAALEFNSNFPENAVRVQVRAGTVFLSGTYYEKHHQDIDTFVKKLRGVGEVQNGEDPAGALGGAGEAERTAADVMIPLSRYPHIGQHVTLREAIVALGASAVRLSDGHLIHPRYILVIDTQDRIVGVVGRRDILKGLTPQLDTLERAKHQIEAVVPHIELPSLMLLHWTSLFSEAAITNSQRAVQRIMAPVRGSVEVTDSLSVVFTTMLQHNIDLVPVMDGERAVGVVLMTDVFDTVAQFILERGAHQPRGADA